MPPIKPNDGEIVWIEYPEGKHFQAEYDSASDTFTVKGESPIKAGDVANWTYEEHDDYDISDDPKEQIHGDLTRD